MKKLVATLGICAILAACGDRQDEGASAPRPARFEFEGKVVTASKGKKESSASNAGSITLQLSASHTSSKDCSVPPPRVVVIPFGKNTIFEPTELTAAGTFPESLDGLRLNVQGNFQPGRTCSPMASSVKDVTVTLPGAETIESTPNAAGSSPQKVTSSAQASTNKAAATERPSPAPPPGAASSLPPLAPVVTSTFRPSLPDPPSG
jgi:hypothetical protein